jgi:hypothetical protein
MLFILSSFVAASAMLFSVGVQPGDTPAPTPIPDPLPAAEPEPEPVVKPWDWQPMTDSSIDMRPMFYPVKNQLFRGSCATFAVVGAMEFFPGVPKLSEAYLYSTLKADTLKIEGANLREMKDYLDANPIVAEEVMPYELVGVFAFDTQSADDVKIGRAFNEKKGRQARLVSDQAIYQARGVSVREGDEITWEWIERTLREGKTIVCGFRMNGDHWTKSGGWIHTNTYKTVLDELSLGDKTSAYEDDGGHAVLAVGYRTIYDPEGTGPVRERRLIHQICIRNSWGIQWGHQGYGWVSWETYGKDRLRQAMTIDRVETLTPTRLDRAPDLRLRWQGFKFKKDDYAVTLSCVIRSNYLPEGGISSVKYTIYSGADKMNEVFEKFPLGDKTSTERGDGFMVNFHGLSDNSLNVKMDVTYALGGTGVFWVPVPELLTWSPEPDVEVPTKP